MGFGVFDFFWFSVVLCGSEGPGVLGFWEGFKGFLFFFWKRGEGLGFLGGFSGL